MQTCGLFLLVLIRVGLGSVSEFDGQVALEWYVPNRKVGRQIHREIAKSEKLEQQAAKGQIATMLTNETKRIKLDGRTRFDFQRHGYERAILRDQLVEERIAYRVELGPIDMAELLGRDSEMFEREGPSGSPPRPKPYDERMVNLESITEIADEPASPKTDLQYFIYTFTARYLLGKLEKSSWDLAKIVTPDDDWLKSSNIAASVPDQNLQKLAAAQDKQFGLLHQAAILHGT